MIPWTDNARRCFADYSARARKSLGDGSVDVNEVLEDLQRHVDEEVRAAGLTVLTEEELRRILTKIGDPALLAEPSPARALPPAEEALQNQRKKPGVFLLILGVVLPALTILVELFTGISAGVLFDPLPGCFGSFESLDTLQQRFDGRVGTQRFLFWRGFGHRAPCSHAPAIRRRLVDVMTKSRGNQSI